MTINRKLAALALATGIGAMNLVTLGTAAQAEGRHGPARPHYAESRRDFDHGRDHRDHREHRRHGSDFAKGLGVGLAAIMMTAIIASEGTRHRADRYDD